MTKLEALPFDPARWPSLQREGWKFSISNDERGIRHFLAISSNGMHIAYETNHGEIGSATPEECWMLPPPVVIEFPLTKQEQAACKDTQYGFESHGDWKFADREARDRYFFAAALDYLRAELAKEEPEAFRWKGKRDDKTVAWRYADAPVPVDDLPNTLIQSLYLHPSETSKCPFIETSKEGTSYCRLAESTREGGKHGT